MPANPKYLTTNKWQKVAKISAAIVGGYLVTTAIHLVLAYWLPDHRVVIITYRYSLYLVWVGLMFVPFMFDNGWKCWALYFVVIVLCAMWLPEKCFIRLYKPK